MSGGERVLEILLTTGRVRRFALVEGKGWSIEWTDAGGAAAWGWRVGWLLLELREPGRLDEFLGILAEGGPLPRHWDQIELLGFYRREFVSLDPHFDRDLWGEFLEICVRYGPVLKGKL